MKALVLFNSCFLSSSPHLVTSHCYSFSTDFQHSDGVLVHFCYLRILPFQVLQVSLQVVVSRCSGLQVVVNLGYLL